MRYSILNLSARISYAFLPTTQEGFTEPLYVLYVDDVLYGAYLTKEALEEAAKQLNESLEK